VLILSANVGEGHAAAARSLAEQIHDSSPGTEVLITDGLAAMGRLLLHVLQDGYRAQLAVAPWSYDITYQALERLPPIRWLAKRLLRRLGSRSLARHIRQHDPDIVVSTYPAVTVVLSHLRRTRRVQCLTVATITDLTGLFFWAQPEIDTHLVMYGPSITPVEAIAGQGSAQLISPLVSKGFLGERTSLQSRRELGLPDDGSVVLVSGGGWGAGRIEEALDTVSALDVGAVVCLAGRNERLHERLEERFAHDPRVRILGFTEEMPQLLSAADVLVHSTGGVTCLEAAASGTPVVSYGLPVGHAKINTEAMAGLGLLSLAHDAEELQRHVGRLLSAPGPRLRTTEPLTRAGHPEMATGAEAVLAVPARVTPLPVWRLRLSTALAQLVLLLSLSGWLMATDTVTSLAGVVLRDSPIQSIAAQGDGVEVVVRTSPQEVVPLARALVAGGIHISFADATPHDTASELAAFHRVDRWSDEAMASLGPSGDPFRWVGTRRDLRFQDRLLGTHHHSYFLEPPNGLSAGQLIMAKLADATPVRGAMQLSTSSPLPADPPKAGAIVVISTPGPLGSSTQGIQRIVGWLQANHLSARPFRLGH
jgi:UDP-N-acetylglucosamine:LPS N-acetylglucosamine transferase